MKIPSDINTLLRLALIWTVFAGSAGGFADPDWTLPLEKCWVFTSGKMTTIPIASDNHQTIFLPQTNTEIKAVAAATGTLLWSVEIPGVFSSGIVSFTDPAAITYAAGPTPQETKRKDGETGRVRVYIADSRTGLSRPLARIAGETRVWPVQYGKNAVVTAADGRMISVSRDQSTKWSVSLGAGVLAGPALSGGRIGLGIAGRQFVVVSADDGSILSRSALEAEASGPVAASDRRFFVGDVRGTVYAFDSGTGKLKWTSRTGGTVFGFDLHRGNPLVSSNDNFVYLLSKHNGRRLWKRKLAGRVLGGALLGRGYAAFVSFASTEVFVIRLRDGRVVNKFDLGKGAFFVSRPVRSGGVLAVATQKGVFGLAVKGTCSRE